MIYKNFMCVNNMFVNKLSYKTNLERVFVVHLLVIENLNIILLPEDHKFPTVDVLGDRFKLIASFSWHEILTIVISCVKLHFGL